MCCFPVNAYWKYGAEQGCDFFRIVSLLDSDPGLRGQMLCAMSSIEKQNSMGLPDTCCFIG